MEDEVRKPFNFVEKENKEETDSKDAKYLIFIFTPFILASMLSFRFNVLRLIVLFCFGIGMIWMTYKSFKLTDYKVVKERLAEVVLIAFTVLAFFYKFFSDLVLSYLALLFVCLLLMLVLNVKNEKTKLLISHYVLLGAFFTAAMLNYKQICLLF